MVVPYVGPLFERRHRRCLVRIAVRVSCTQPSAELLLYLLVDLLPVGLATSSSYVLDYCSQLPDRHHLLLL